MRSTLILALVMTTLGTGCAAGTRMALKDPMMQQCSGAGLQGCDAITDGALLYIDGKTAQGTEKLRAGAMSNAPGEVKVFVLALRTLAKTPGTDSFKAELNGIADVLSPDATPIAAMVVSTKSTDPASTTTTTTTVSANVSAVGAGEVPPPVRDDATTLRVGTVVPLADPRARSCAFGPTEAGATTTCTRAVLGPIVVTDLETTGTCPVSLFVFSGDPERPTWFLTSSASTPLNVHGAQFLVPDSESFMIGAKASANAVRKDLDCGVTWAGRRL